LIDYYHAGWNGFLASYNFTLYFNFTDIEAYMAISKEIDAADSESICTQSNIQTSSMAKVIYFYFTASTQFPSNLKKKNLNRALF